VRMQQGASRRWSAAVVGLAMLTGMAVVVEIDRAQPASAEVGASTSVESRLGGDGTSTDADLAGLLLPDAYEPSLSDDGRIVAFTREEDEFGYRPRVVYIRDRSASFDPEMTEDAIPDWTDAQPGDAIIRIGGVFEEAWAPAVSGDGCHVAFLTEASFVGGEGGPDTGGIDAYRYTRPECTEDGQPAMRVVSLTSYLPGTLQVEPSGPSTDPVDFGYDEPTTIEFSVTAGKGPFDIEVIRSIFIFGYQPPGGDGTFELGPPLTEGVPACEAGTVLRATTDTGTCYFTVVAEPSSAAEVAARVRVNGTFNQTDVYLVVNQTAQLVADPSPLVGTNSATVTIGATGPGQALITDISARITGGSFTVSSSPEGGCEEGVTVLVAGQTCTLVVSTGSSGGVGFVDVLTPTPGRGVSVPVDLDYLGMRIAHAEAAFRAPARLPLLAEAAFEGPLALGSVDSFAISSFESRVSISGDGGLVAFSADTPLLTANGSSPRPSTWPTCPGP
jgi:hypothetical protein